MSQYFNTQTKDNLTIIEFLFEELSIDSAEEIKREMTFLIEDGSNNFITARFTTLKLEPRFFRFGRNDNQKHNNMDANTIITMIIKGIKRERRFFFGNDVGLSVG